MSLRNWELGCVWVVSIVVVECRVVRRVVEQCLVGAAVSVVVINLCRVVVSRLLIECATIVFG